jgi:hypothetical protein
MKELLASLASVTTERDACAHTIASQGPVSGAPLVLSPVQSESWAGGASDLTNNKIKRNRGTCAASRK